MNPFWSLLIGGVVIGGLVGTLGLEQSRSREVLAQAHTEAAARKALRQASLQILSKAMQASDGGVVYDSSVTSLLQCTSNTCVAMPSAFTDFRVPGSLRIEVCPVYSAPLPGNPSPRTFAEAFTGLNAVQGGVSNSIDSNAPLLIASLSDASALQGCEALYRKVAAGEAPQADAELMPRFLVLRGMDYRTGSTQGIVLAPVESAAELAGTHATPQYPVGAVRLARDTGFYYQYRRPAKYSGTLYEWQPVAASPNEDVRRPGETCEDGMVAVPGGVLPVLRDEPAGGTGSPVLTGRSQDGVLMQPACMGKYEASIPADNPGLSAPVAHAPGLVPARVTQATARALCAKRGWRLMSEWERRWLNYLVVNEKSNWTSGVVGQGRLFSGHSNNSPAQLLPASPDDSQGTFGIVGTVSELASQRRTLNLPDGTVLWDLAGNAAEWVDWRIDPRAWRAYRDASVYNPADGGEQCALEGPCSATRTSSGYGTMTTRQLLMRELFPETPGVVVGTAHGAGAFFRPALAANSFNTARALNNVADLDESAGGATGAVAYSAVLRGGSFNQGDGAGVLAIDVRYGAGYVGAGGGTTAVTGFRCVK